ncbi:unnamed protein product [Enterobius vermicularis]|uniref:Transmembrane protein n=1 Tax=Enterobius vermicularis TaxID=51028 RepID=A0A0N4V3S2_ENTVE|nr:unnamed protein product [Enterobius vermicularis]
MPPYLVDLPTSQVARCPTDAQYLIRHSTHLRTSFSLDYSKFLLFLLLAVLFLENLDVFGTVCVMQYFSYTSDTILDSEEFRYCDKAQSFGEVLGKVYAVTIHYITLHTRCHGA